MAAVLLAGVFIVAPADGQESSEVPDHFELVYAQDFEGDNPLQDFVFSDASAWQLASGGDNQYLELKGGTSYDPPHNSPSSVGLIVPGQFSSFVLEARIQYTGPPDHGHGDHCVFFNVQNRSEFYYAHIGNNQDDVSHQIHLVDNAPRTPITEKSPDSGYDWPEDKWSTIRVVRNAKTGKIAVYAGDMETPTLTATDKTHKIGWIGFGSYGDTGKVDNVRVWTKNGKMRKRDMNKFESK